MGKIHIIFCVTFLFGVLDGHVVRFKKCPNIPETREFDVEQFLGKWYIIESFGGYSSCMTLTMEQESDNEIQVTKKREFPAFNSILRPHMTSSNGYITIPAANTSAVMIVRWNGIIGGLGKTDFIVMSTDYETFALIHECQSLWSFFSRRSFSILSRTNTLDSATIAELEQLVADENIDTSHFRVVDHANCSEDVEKDVGIGSNSTFAAINEQLNNGDIEDEIQLAEALNITLN